MSQQQSFAAQLTGAAITLAVVGGLIYGALVGIPYLHTRLSQPIAGAANNPASLTGNWIGTVQAQRTVDYMDYMRGGGRGVPPPQIEPAALQLTASPDFDWGTAKFSGTVQLCTASGNRVSGSYAHEPALTATKVIVMVRSASETMPTDVEADLAAGSLHVSWKYHDDATVTGDLHKQAARQDMDSLCRAVHAAL